MEQPRLPGAKKATFLSNRELLTSAALGAAGVLLAFAALYAGTGVHDGFGDWDLHRTARRLRRMLIWLIPAAAVAGPVLRDSYHRFVERRPGPWDYLHAVARLLAHLMLWVMSILLAGVLRLMLLPLKWLARRLGLYAGALNPFPSSWFATPVWFFAFPFAVEGGTIPNDEGEPVEILSPDRLSTRRILLWLPWLMTGIWFWTGAVDEDSGERIDPRWLFAAASYWFADFLIVARQVVPELKSSDQA